MTMQHRTLPERHLLISRALPINQARRRERALAGGWNSLLQNRFGLLPRMLALISLIGGLYPNSLPAADNPGSASKAKDDLAIHVFNELVARTNGSPQLFSSQVNGTTFVRSTRFWLHGLNDLTATHVGYGPGATAITPWHVLGANHYKHDVGSQVCFADLAGRTVTRNIVAGQEIRPDIKSDIWLGVLDHALPVSIAPMPLMPANWSNLVHSKALPVAAMNQSGCFGSAALVSFRQPVAGWFSHGYAYFCLGLTPALQFEPLRGGDSGHPIVTLVDTDLVLLGHITFEAGGNKLVGPDYSSYASDIQAAIASLGTNGAAQAQKIEIVDLSRFQ